MDIIHWAAVPIRQGALEGNPGTLLLQWKIGHARASLSSLMTTLKRQREDNMDTIHVHSIITSSNVSYAT